MRLVSVSETIIFYEMSRSYIPHIVIQYNTNPERKVKTKKQKKYQFLMKSNRGKNQRKHNITKKYKIGELSTKTSTNEK